MGDSQASVETGRVNRGPAASVRQRNSKSAVRILVVGRRGSGKSTLIRMLVGDKGPRTIRHGHIVLQDITKEWKHPDLPFIIHDSNGVTGGEGKDEIESFLRKRQGSSKVDGNDIWQRVDVIWYVFSALDNRIKNDDGLLEMLKKHGNEFPILLIMTHHKGAKAIGNGMAENVMEDVLECICGRDKRRRSRMQEMIVRVENNVSVDKEGKVVKEISVDKEALSLVVAKTKILSSVCCERNLESVYNYNQADESYNIAGSSGEPFCSDYSERIQRAYANLISDNDQVKEDLKETFKEVRILVVGKTGCGKTTLIRMLLGDNQGPRSIRHGAVGVQNIRREWRHPDLPFIIHDSNGIDTSGERRMEGIRRFLGERQAYDINVVNRFQRRVQAVWYVFSALDNRVADDHGLLNTIASYGKELPLLLIMTHHKRAAATSNGMAEKVMDQVLECVSDEQGKETRRSRLRQSMVRVENNVKVHRQGEIVEEIDVDKEGLTMVVERTKELMKEEEVWMTWAACQAVSMKLKVEASVSLILERPFHQWLATIFVGLIPALHQVQMAIMFATFTHGLAKIWRAYPHLEQAIVSCRCFHEGRMSAVLSNLGRNIMAALAVVAIVMTVLVSKGIVTIGCGGLHPLIIQYLKGNLVSEKSELVKKLVEAVTYIFSEPGNTSKLLMSYGLLVLGAILYAHVRDLSAVLPPSADQYSRLFEEFLKSEWARQISAISEGYSFNLAAGSLLRDHDKQRLLVDIITFFEKLCGEKYY